MLAGRLFTMVLVGRIGLPHVVSPVSELYQYGSSASVRASDHGVVAAEAPTADNPAVPSSMSPTTSTPAPCGFSHDVTPVFALW